MDTYTAETLIRDEMNRYGLIASGWQYDLDGARTRMGVCKHNQKLISLSRHYVRLNDRADILNTIRHEIAHALVGSGHGHDYVWKRKAREVGADPKAYAGSHVKVAYKWLARCKCGREFGRNRLTQSVRYNSACPTCKDALTWSASR